MSYTVENAVLQWEEGYRRLQDARSEPASYLTLGRIVVAIEGELRKRLGSTFTVAELVSLYRDGGDWALDVAMQTAPGRSDLWDSSTVVDAAFYLYMREAADFAGGSLRRLPPE